ncbi:hypothetical protein BOVA604_4404 [Bacteroides ovatus]|nr:hypothetical protein BOVA711_4598 [Bacteroides ovatus]CAG9894024.1 hypothetical protein BOVA713_1590 [Bacteroides ovatus]CAG9901293.1 hypothetical protein BOVA604_4404 [Bacteroides ovatus]CAG9908539.1 hypothetical protein BOVAC16_501 [Bacteroides ovatus]CAG9910831.1 hypothetical protein BOVA172_2426 [Bacteroides ovatus]
MLKARILLFLCYVGTYFSIRSGIQGLSDYYRRESFST